MSMSLTEIKDVMIPDGQTRQFARKACVLRTTTSLAILLCLLGAARSEAAELKQKTLQTWEAYVQTTKLAMEQRAAGRSPFLWVDESPDLLRRVRSGELVVSNRDHSEVPSGLIHHWVGAMFLPGVTLDEVNAVFNDYNHYPDFYRPRIVKVKVLEQTDDYQKVTMLMVQRAFGVTGAVEADDEIHIIKLDAHRLYSLSNATRVQEIVDYGQPGERLPSENQGPGYVWRSLSMNRLEQRDGGVYIEMEMISLSRGIPIQFRWLIKPLTQHLPRTIMLETLKDTRNAVIERNQNAGAGSEKSSTASPVSDSALGNQKDAHHAPGDQIGNGREKNISDESYPA
jgi:hypothetical protein